MPSKDWPPARRSDEADDLWMDRLNTAIADEHRLWLDELAQGDEAKMGVLLELLIPPPDVDDDHSDFEPLNDDELRKYIDRCVSNGMAFMTAVRSGDPDAVSEYADFELFMMQFNTAHREPPATT